MFASQAVKMTEWKEREHEMDSMVALHDANAIMALCQCSLLKLFKMQSMRQQMALLDMLISMWNFGRVVLSSWGNMVTIQLEYVYFLIGLSRGGAQVSPLGNRGGGEMIETYIATYCHPETRKTSGKNPINNVMELSLCTIMFTFIGVAGSTSPHLACKA